ncbi:MAG: type II 3-dehydroquinate dehydratase [Bacillota bacterium]
MKILVISGPNLNLLGTREPELYGRSTVADVEERLAGLAEEMGVELECVQSNSEGELIDHIHRAGKEADGIVINPAAYGHYSIAMRDALAAVSAPAVEVHMTNVHAREDFRARSVVAPVCAGGVWGFGAAAYEWGLRALVDAIERGIA